MYLTKLGSEGVNWNVMT